MILAPRLNETCEALGLDPREVARRPTLDVIVGLPDRASCDRFERHCEEDLGLEVEDHLPGVNGFSTTLDHDDLVDLRDRLPRGAVVQLDQPIPFRPMMVDSEPALPDAPLDKVFQPILPGIDRVHQQGFTGRGVTVAVIDSGIYPHPDLKDRIVDWVDFTDDKKASPADIIGHGTNVAGILAGNGARSGGKITGAAPEANLVGVRVGTAKEAIQGVQWVIENKDRLGIKVINMSLGVEASVPMRKDLWAQVTQKAIDAGLIVVVSAGNDGPRQRTINTPGALPDAITVGAYDNHRTPGLEDDTVATDSSRGPSPFEDAPKPDVVAPGMLIFGALAPGSRKDSPERPRIARDYYAESGTSQAAPQIAGLAACLLQANPQLDQRALKEILRRSATAGVPGGPEDQGAGLVQADRALALALA